MFKEGRMKYFKYKWIKKIPRLADKQLLASLKKDVERKIKRNRFIIKIIGILGVFLFCILMSIFIYFITLIPTPKLIILKVLYGILLVILAFISLILSFLIIGYPTSFLLSKFNYNLPQMKKEHIAKACEGIRAYYGLKDDYIITKCFTSTNEIFNNHDICIFRVEDEIRITTDIVNGFINAKCDLGCYAIKIDELKLTKKDYNNKRVSVIEFNDTRFIVGIKAYSYIRKFSMVKLSK